MTCPHCSKGVNIFRQSFFGRRHRDLTCPHCGAPVRTNVRNKPALLVFLGLDLLASIVAPALSPAKGQLLVASCAGIAVIIGVISLTQFELLPTGPRESTRYDA